MMNLVEKGGYQSIEHSLKLVDFASLAIAFLLASSIFNYLSVDISLSDFLSMRIKVFNFIIFAGFMSMCLIIFTQCRLYQSRRLYDSRGEVFDILRSTLFVVGLLIIISELLKISIVNTLFIIVFWSALSLMMIFNRIIIRYIAKALHLRGLDVKSVLIIGTNDRAINLSKVIDSRPEFGYRVHGFVDEQRYKNEKFRNNGHRVISTIDDLPLFLRNNPIDEVIVCLPLGSFYHKVAKIVELCENQGINIRIPTDFFTLVLAQSKIESFAHETMITMVTGSMYGWPVAVKRAFDIIGSALLLVMLSPIFTITGIIIKLTSPGPLFFVQDRVGFNKRIFKMYKFRTMVVDAEKRQADLEKLNEASGPVFKIKQDPRITPIGKILRKLSIDELPQIFNVLKGDMSLVGPRPLPIRDYQGFNEDWHRRRFSVRPGITCLWQIKGRSNISFDAWMELDMYYIDNWSLWLDGKILLGTIPAVMKGSGAA
jgi:exopolysaccharide biosynthesis polyprenyl glycosylphosphotransferase